MDIVLAKKVLASLPSRQVSFRYFKDRYALQLLAYAAAEWRSLADVRRGRFRALLQKPSVRRILGETGVRGVDWHLLDSYFPKGTEDYVLTLGLWGSDLDSTWNQTTRPGFNVVVQLNFPSAHHRALRRYIEPGEEEAFNWRPHPTNDHGHLTLAWARLDIDLDCGEALIEEIQSDWIKDADRVAEQALASLIAGELDTPAWLGDARCGALQAFRYVQYVLAPHRRIWDQAVLGASLWLLREHLGIRRIYMHTYEGGCVLKRMTRWRPPRSLYEQVPRSFCFERVVEAPRFLRSTLGRERALSRCEFWCLRI